jgi:hypothetical protein
MPNWAPAAAIAFAIVVLVLGIIAFTRCPADEIVAMIRAIGSWLHVRIELRI